MGIQLKDEATIVKLREGGKLLASILDELETKAVAGATTLDIDDHAMMLMEQHELTPMTLGYHAKFAPRPYPAGTCISINDVLVHGIPNENPLTIQDGDVVSIDLVIGYKDVVLDSARTVGVGEISDEAKKLLNVTREALACGIKAAQPGNYVQHIGQAIEKVVPKQFGIVEALCGHGVGYEIHEDPIVPNFDMGEPGAELVPGMVIAIEPMLIAGSKEVVFDEEDGYTVYTADGGLGAHMEHTVFITENGPEILTKR